MFDWVGVIETGRKIAALNMGAGSGGDLCEAATSLVALRSFVEAGLFHALAELDARGTCDEEFGLGTGAWMAHETSTPSREARHRVQVGRRLRSHLAEVDAALVEGSITAEHATVLADACGPRTAKAVAALQRELLDLADHCGFDQWRRQVRAIVELLDQDGGHDPNEDLARNRLHVNDTLDGTTILNGKLVGDTALGVKQAIEAMADELFTRFTRDHEISPDIAVPNRTTLRALALAELVRRGQATDPHQSKAPRPDATLVINATDPTTAADPATGHRLPDGTVRPLLCDPDLRSIVIDSLGVPLDAGTTVRFATAAQRRALALRDGGCVFPGCEAPPSWVDIHHLDTRPHRTDLSRLAALCRHHHTVTHRPGWTLHTTTDGWYWWTTPSGRTFWSQRHQRQRTGPTPHDPRHPDHRVRDGRGNPGDPPGDQWTPPVHGDDPPP